VVWTAVLRSKRFLMRELFPKANINADGVLLLGHSRRTLARCWLAVSGPKSAPLQTSEPIIQHHGEAFPQKNY
jgi:hypothetical protein